MDGLVCFHLVLAMLSCAAMCMVVVGFSTPGWFVVTFQEDKAQAEFTVDSLNRSLFYDVFCPQDLKTCKLCRSEDAAACVTEVNSPDYLGHFLWIERLTADKEEWTAWRVIMIVVLLAAVVGFILVLVLVCCRLRPFTYRIVAVSGFICWLASGLLVWVPVGMIADMYLTVDDDVNANVVAFDGVNHDATLHVPYSAVVSAIGGILAIIVAFMLLWLTGVCGRKDTSDSRSDDSQILSDRSKVIVQDGRYQGPYGYYPQETNGYYREQQPEYYPNYARSHDEFEQSRIKDTSPYSWGQPIYDNRYGQSYGYH